MCGGVMSQNLYFIAFTTIGNKSIIRTAHNQGVIMYSGAYLLTYNKIKGI